MAIVFVNEYKRKNLDNLTHIAIASLNDCRYIVSWNFKHFANLRTIKAVNAINLSEVYAIRDEHSRRTKDMSFEEYRKLMDAEIAPALLALNRARAALKKAE